MILWFLNTYIIIYVGLKQELRRHGYMHFSRQNDSYLEIFSHIGVVTDVKH